MLKNDIIGGDVSG